MPSATGKGNKQQAVLPVNMGLTENFFPALNMTLCITVLALGTAYPFHSQSSPPQLRDILEPKRTLSLDVPVAKTGPTGCYFGRSYM